MSAQSQKYKQFHIRLDPSLRRQLLILRANEGKSMKELVEQALLQTYFLAVDVKEEEKNENQQ